MPTDQHVGSPAELWSRRGPRGLEARLLRDFEVWIIERLLRIRPVEADGVVLVLRIGEALDAVRTHTVGERLRRVHPFGGEEARISGVGVCAEQRLGAE